MRIAVPTNDGASISEHFGRSAGFLVFEIADGQIGRREVRRNAGQHTHGKEGCGEGAKEHGAHNHAGILSSLTDCDVVICAGMGRRAAEALESAGIATVVTTQPASAEEAVHQYLRGELAGAAADFCHCRH
ncbi:MAG TPA: NifB/NifX family molybdenum-iron cluster-binding protein [Bryobacteraceae bacterium]|nr:NifB/NifX family molybdenum-iron cluster-binding protein [Bryobacteraceae bacterium]